MHLLAGLGNPGAAYIRNRHNVGFLAIDRIATEYGCGPFRERFSGLCADGRIGPHRVLLLKPQTYMNESGNSVSAATHYYKIPPEAVTVIHDEIDLAPGSLRVRSTGGLAGHRGLRSVRAHLGDDFRRVRIGVGHPGAARQVTDHVLGDFGPEDRDWLESLLARLAESLPLLLDGEDSRFAAAVADS